MMKPIFLGAILSLLVSSAAWAVPAASPGQQPGFHSSDVLNIGWRDRHRDRHWKRGYRDHVFHDDYRYRGWKRYSYRPYDWDDRGCVSVGPIWYCS
jgi:hypothetical protein